MGYKKRIKRKVGDIVKIDIGDGFFCFGHVLKEPLMAFYNLKVNSETKIDEIVSAPILFKVWVMKNVITSGHWPVIGWQALDEGLEKPVVFFKQDPINKKLSLYANSKETPATKEECKGLEAAAVWSGCHIEDRLQDHFAGISNKWVESLKIS